MSKGLTVIQWFKLFRAAVERSNPDLLDWIDHNSGDWKTLLQEGVAPDVAAKVFCVLARSYRDNIRDYRMGEKPVKEEATLFEVTQ